MNDIMTPDELLASCASQEWMHGLPVYRELSGRDPAGASVTPTITLESNYPVVLGRMQLAWDTATTPFLLGRNGLQVGTWNLNRSRQGVTADIFLPNSPGLVGANYLGLPLLPGQTINISGTAPVAADVSVLVFCRPMTPEERVAAEQLRTSPAGVDLLFGLGSASIGAGLVGTLSGTVERPVNGELGYLILSPDVTAAPGDLRVVETRVAGQRIDGEVVASNYDVFHRSHTNAFGRAIPLDASLSPGQTVEVDVLNTTLGALRVDGGFIRRPRVADFDGQTGLSGLPRGARGFGGGIPMSSLPAASEAEVMGLIAAAKAGELPAAQRNRLRLIGIKGRGNDRMVRQLVAEAQQAGQLPRVRG